MLDLLKRTTRVLGKAIPTATAATYSQGASLIIELGRAIAQLEKDEPDVPPRFQIGDIVRKLKGAQWQGKVVGTYSTSLTPEGYCVESDAHPGSVQIYPAAALELVRAAP